MIRRQPTRRAILKSAAALTAARISPPPALRIRLFKGAASIATFLDSPGRRD
jgi:hypothetical protein